MSRTERGYAATRRGVARALRTLGFRYQPTLSAYEILRTDRAYAATSRPDVSGMRTKWRAALHRRSQIL
eukprot:2266677-Rhodomonas_salina.10